MKKEKVQQLTLYLIVTASIFENRSIRIWSVKGGVPTEGLFGFGGTFTLLTLAGDATPPMDGFLETELGFRFPEPGS